jgi:hypothetical protein
MSLFHDGEQEGDKLFEMRGRCFGKVVKKSAFVCMLTQFRTFSFVWFPITLSEMFAETLRIHVSEKRELPGRELRACQGFCA